MKVLLAYPYCLEKRIHQEDAHVTPIGLFYVAAALKEAGHQVSIENWSDAQGDSDRIKEALITKAPSVIGLSIVNANRWGGIEVARLAKTVLPDVTVVFGGIGTTFLWRHLLTHFEVIDFAVIGEGERTLPALLKCLTDNQQDQLNTIPGLAFRQDADIFNTSPADAIETLDDLPRPSAHFAYQHMALTRGCAYQCTFCGSPRFWGRKVRFHSAEYFVDQLAHQVRRGIRFFYFSDDTFTMRRGTTIEVCRRIIDRGLTIDWAAISRVNFVDEEMLAWMRKAGCIQISYGIESGSERIRKHLGKNFSAEDIETAFAATIQYGIMARAYFIYGCPEETWETIQETLDLIQRIKPLGTIFYILTLFPGTTLYEQYKKDSGVSDDIWLERIEDILYFQTDPHLTRGQVMAFGQRLRETYYRALPQFADAVQVVEQKEFFPLHGDFFSRLAMTFHQGDYARIDAIPDKLNLARRLYRKALTYHPVRRAFLGLGLLEQQTGRIDASISVLYEGLSYYPEEENLGICLGVSHMHRGEVDQALGCFKKFPRSPQAKAYIRRLSHQR